MCWQIWFFSLGWDNTLLPAIVVVVEVLCLSFHNYCWDTLAVRWLGRSNSWPWMQGPRSCQDPVSVFADLFAFPCQTEGERNKVIMFKRGAEGRVWWLFDWWWLDSFHQSTHDWRWPNDSIDRQDEDWTQLPWLWVHLFESYWLWRMVLQPPPE